MPVTVIVGPPGEAAARLTFDGTQRIVFGRGPSCDVRLPDPSVSHRHAYLRAEEGEFLLFDEGSTNGTHVGGVRIAPRHSRVVRSGEIVRMGRMSLELRMEPEPITRDVAGSTRELALWLVSQALDAAGEDTTAALRIVEGRDQGRATRLRDEGREYVVGRGEECDLVVADSDASRQHACVRRDGEQVSVRDLDSKNGTWLGRARVSPGEYVRWSGSTMLRVGRTVLALDRPLQDALARIEEAPDECVQIPDELGLETIASGVPEGLVIAGALASGSAESAEAPVGPMSPAARAGLRPGRARGGRVSLFDVLVVLASLIVLGLSLAGLVWLLRS